MPEKAKKIRSIFIIYWFLLAYIIAALVWWFIALSRQNEQMMNYKLLDLHQDDPAYFSKSQQIENERKRKTAQYAGEGSIFLLLILAGAIFVYRTVRREFSLNRQQQHFMMAVTHELKTPIAIAKLNLETLQKRKLDEQQQQKLLSNTLQEANRMNALCNNMLISSQFEAGGYRITREALDITALIRHCISDFRSRYPNKILREEVQDNISMQGDELLLQLAVNNLIDNAIKYTPRDTAVSITLRKDKIKLAISVADEGPGIADSDKQRVFRKFERLGNEATRLAKGTGLGLYLTRKIVSEHNGSLDVSDNKPSGSIFTIKLPVTES